MPPVKASQILWSYDPANLESTYTDLDNNQKQVECIGQQRIQNDYFDSNSASVDNACDMTVAQHDMQMHQSLTTLEQNCNDTNILIADNTEVLRDNANSIDKARKIEMAYFEKHTLMILKQMDKNRNQVIQIIHDNDNASRYRDEQISSEISDLKQIIQKSREIERELEETKTELSVCKAEFHKLLKLNN